jgi:toxin secretion/phage lysis holin
VMLVMAVFLDRLINDGQWIVRSLVTYFYIANEGISILENIAKMGVPIPNRISDILEQLKKEK